MPKATPQSFAKHARRDPWFHFVLIPSAILLLAARIHVVIRDHRYSHENVLWVLTAAWLIVLAFRMRIYSIKVQDRVIRLEERLRLAALLPEPLRARIPELTERQLIALRFASDAEIPALVERTLRENLDPKTIKKSIQSWRPDYWRV